MPLPPSPPPPGLPRGGRSPGGEGGSPPSAKGRGGRGARLRGLLLLGGLLRPRRAGLERPAHAVAPHARVGGGGARASYVRPVLNAVYRVWSPWTENPPARRPCGPCGWATCGCHCGCDCWEDWDWDCWLLHLRAQWPCSPHLKQAPGGPGFCGLRGLLAGQELAFVDPKSRSQGGPRAVGQRSCHLRLTVTLLRCLGFQKDDERLHQLALPRVAKLHVRNTLHLAQG